MCGRRSASVVALQAREPRLAARTLLAEPTQTHQTGRCMDADGAGLPAIEEGVFSDICQNFGFKPSEFHLVNQLLNNTDAGGRYKIPARTYKSIAKDRLAVNKTPFSPLPPRWNATTSSSDTDSTSEESSEEQNSADPESEEVSDEVKILLHSNALIQAHIQIGRRV